MQYEINGVLMNFVHQNQKMEIPINKKKCSEIILLDEDDEQIISRSHLGGCFSLVASILFLVSELSMFDYGFPIISLILLFSSFAFFSLNKFFLKFDKKRKRAFREIKPFLEIEQKIWKINEALSFYHQYINDLKSAILKEEKTSELLNNPVFQKIESTHFFKNKTLELQYQLAQALEEAQQAQTEWKGSLLLLQLERLQLEHQRLLSQKYDDDSILAEYVYGSFLPPPKEVSMDIDNHPLF